MMRRLTFFALVAVLAFNGCRRVADVPVKQPAALMRYVAAYTAGLISAESDITVRLQQPLRRAGEGRRLFRIIPPVAGREIWLDDHTVVFRPDDRLPSGKTLDVQFKLNALTEVPPEVETVFFRPRVIRQEAAVLVEGLEYRGDTLGIAGVVETADTELPDRIASMLALNGRGGGIRVNRLGGNRYAFFAHGLERRDDAYTAELTYNPERIGASGPGRAEVRVPANGEFMIEQAVLVSEAPMQVSLVFSEPLDPMQSLTGKIRVGNSEVTGAVIRENRIDFFADAALSGLQTLQVEAGIRSRSGLETPVAYTRGMVLSSLKPALRKTGTGVILPLSGNLLYSFEAVNLRSVVVEITRVYEDNMLQFLQAGEVDEYNELYRVGNPVYEGRVNLAELGPLSQGASDAFALDLSKLIRVEPGALYHVALRFYKQDAVLSCAALPVVLPAPVESDYDEEYGSSRGGVGEDGLTDQWGFETDENVTLNPVSGEPADVYGYPIGFRWQYRDDPCHVSYYLPERWQRSNMMATDLAITAKVTDGGRVYAHVRDLVTTGPRAGATVEVFDYVRRPLAKGTTAADGSVDLGVVKKPAFMVASHGQNRAYVKLQEAYALSVAAFDVSGESTPSGLRGRFYTERGVWRPGDSLYAVFVLDERFNEVPKPFPVSFELINPRGVIVKRFTRKESVNGLYDARTSTRFDAPTGNWTLRALAGGLVTDHRIRIETIKPNRLKLTLKEFRMDTASFTLKADFESAWLHGAKGANLPVKMELGLWPAPAVFEGFSRYSFDDPSRTMKFEPVPIFDALLDENGKGSAKYAIARALNPSGFVKARLNTRVFEPSGDFSAFQDDQILKLYPVFAGVAAPEGDSNNMLLTDKDQRFDLVSLTPDGTPAPGRKLTIRTYKMTWRWWWEGEEDYRYEYVSREDRMPYSDQTITTDARGRGFVNLKVPNSAWGRYRVEVLDPGGHRASRVVYFDWPGWAGRARGGADAATRLSFTTARPDYKTGEMIEVVLPAGNSGSMLVSVENNAGVLKHEWVEVTGPEVRYRFAATKEMAPTIYVHATLIQPQAKKMNDAPIRLYGIVPVKVENPESRLSPVLDMPAEFRPESKAMVRVSEKNGRPMTYTLAVVDEGLLDLTRFKTPDLWTQFNAKTALGVRTHDMYDFVAGAYGLAAARVAVIGGDDAIKAKESSVIRFKPMVRFYGPYNLEAGKTAEIEVDVPQYIGSVRAMVVSARDGAYGAAEKTGFVRNPLMVLTTLPRSLGPSESVTIPVSVFSMSPEMREVSVKLAVSGAFAGAPPLEKTIRFKGEGEQMVYFEVKTGSKGGAGSVEVTASGAGHQARENLSIAIENQAPYISQNQMTEVNLTLPYAVTLDPIGTEGTNHVSIEISPIPVLNMTGRLSELIQYPHGCIEQTISRAFPQLFIPLISQPDLVQSAGIQKHVRTALDDLARFQLPGGAFGYWPDATMPHPWASAYAVHFLTEARLAGYAVPETVLKNGLASLRAFAKGWSPEKLRYDALQQAYRLYVLALAGMPETGAMNRLRDRKDLEPEARWRLAGAYALIGQKEAATSLTTKITLPLVIPRETGNTFGSDLRDRAMMLEVQTLTGDLAGGWANYRYVAETLSGKKWLSTQETAYALMAAARFAGKRKGDGARAELWINGRKINLPEVLISAQTITVPQVEAQAPVKLEAKNLAASALFVSVHRRGKAPLEAGTAVSENLQLSVSYRNRAGQPVDITTLEQGADVFVDVVVKNPGLRGNYEEMALATVFPSGWEVRNPRLEQVNPNDAAASRPDYQDQRDNVVYSYFDLPVTATKTFRFQVTATHRGRFFLPPVEVEAMYDRSIHARTAGNWVHVKAPD